VQSAHFSVLNVLQAKEVARRPRPVEVRRMMISKVHPAELRRSQLRLLLGNRSPEAGHALLGSSRAFLHGNPIAPLSGAAPQPHQGLDPQKGNQDSGERLMSPLRCPRFVLGMLVVFGVLAAIATTPAFAASDNCPAVNAVKSGTFLQSDKVTASFTGPVVDASFNSTFTYLFSGSDGTSVDGIPGLITYCVYPAEPPGNPDAGVALAVGADGITHFVFKTAVEGSFSFTRGGGNPTNLPMDGATDTVGTATWFPTGCTTDPITLITTCTPVSPANQTILLHINDPAECTALYGNDSTGNPTQSCFVFPNGGGGGLCNGNPACKSAQISDIDGNTFGVLDGSGNVIVPPFTKLFIDYTYVIINQPTNTFDMIFKFPPAKTDINNGGGKDYFGCEQLPNSAGFPGGWVTTTITDVEGNVWKLTFTQGGGTCNQSRFTLLPNSTTITLHPGESVTFTVNMVTRTNKGGKQEYTSTGLHLLNSGFTVKWFQNGGTCPNGTPASLKNLCSFSTSNTPIYVDVQK
jgi:hypothetical protein